MPEAETTRRVEQDRREGKAPSTQAGEYAKNSTMSVRETQARMLIGA